MAELASLTLRYTAPPSATVKESRWIRLEQLRPQDESLTVAEAAQAIDALFGIEPCDTGLEGGGEEVAYDEEGLPADAPSESRFAQVMREMMGDELCERAKHWYADVLVLRSHQQPGYTLRSETATVVGTSLVRTTVREELDFEGSTSKDLGMPYDGDLAGLPSGVTATVLGSTVNLSAPAGRLSLRYTSQYEQVRLQVPVADQARVNAQDRLERPPLPEAAVVAFWGELAAACELSPPEQDERISQDELEQLCRGADADYALGGPQECWQTLEHYQLCNCSRKRKNVWREVVPVTCPDGADASSYFVNNRSVFDGYVHCDGEEDEVHEAWFYESKCCWPPSKPLPRCRKTYNVWRGGAEIEYGPPRWFDIYGPGTRLVPVSPPSGVCGEIVTEWEVRPASCCDQAPEMSIDPEVAPEVMADNSEAYIQIIGGLGPYTVSTESAGLYIDQIGDKRLQTMSTMIRLCSTQICGMVSVAIADACGHTATHLIRATRGRWQLRTVLPPGRLCVDGTPVLISGAQYEVIAGAYRMVFARIKPSFCRDMRITDAEALCTTTVGPGMDYDGCDYWPHVDRVYENPANNCPSQMTPHTRQIECNGAWEKMFYDWVC